MRFRLISGVLLAAALAFPALAPDELRQIDRLAVESGINLWERSSRE